MRRPETPAKAARRSDTRRRPGIGRNSNAYCTSFSALRSTGRLVGGVSGAAWDERRRTHPRPAKARARIRLIVMPASLSPSTTRAPT